MKQIIDIPDELFNIFKKHGIMAFDYVNEYDKDQIAIAITHGTPYNPTDDLISRSDLKKELEVYRHDETRYVSDEEQAQNSLLDNILEDIDNAQAIPLPNEQIAWEQGYEAGLAQGKQERPQGEWIPVCERLPNDRDWCLGVFREPDTGFIGLPYICDYVGEVTKGTTNEGWILRHCTDVDNASAYFRNLICVAWKPLPEPYKKGGAE